MRRQRVLFFIGIWVIIVPFLGFPNLWKEFIFIITGLGIMYLSYREYREWMNTEGAAESRMKPYAEARPIMNDMRTPRRKKAVVEVIAVEPEKEEDVYVISHSFDPKEEN